MPTVIMPKMGDAMEEGTLLRWLKQVGEEVAIGDPLAEIETDKVSLEIEATEAGVLSRQHVDEGATVPIGTAIATIGEDGAEAEAVAPEPGDALRRAASRRSRRYGREPGAARRERSERSDQNRCSRQRAGCSIAFGPGSGRACGRDRGSDLRLGRAAARLAAGQTTRRRTWHRPIERHRHRAGWAHRARRHRRAAHRRGARGTGPRGGTGDCRPLPRSSPGPGAALRPARPANRRAARDEQDPAHHRAAHGRVESRRPPFLCHLRGRHASGRGAARADQRAGSRRRQGLVQRPDPQGGGAGTARAPRTSTSRWRATSSSTTRASTSTSRSPSRAGSSPPS